MEPQIWKQVDWGFGGWHIKIPIGEEAVGNNFLLAISVIRKIWSLAGSNGCQSLLYCTDSIMVMAIHFIAIITAIQQQLPVLL